MVISGRAATLAVLVRLELAETVTIAGDDAPWHVLTRAGRNIAATLDNGAPTLEHVAYVVREVSRVNWNAPQTFTPNEPGATTLADARPLFHNGSAVSVVWHPTTGVATCYAGTDVIGERKDVDDMTMGEAQTWSVKCVLKGDILGAMPNTPAAPVEYDAPRYNVTMHTTRLDQWTREASYGWCEGFGCENPDAPVMIVQSAEMLGEKAMCRECVKAYSVCVEWMDASGYVRTRDGREMVKLVESHRVYGPAVTVYATNTESAERFAYAHVPNGNPDRVTDLMEAARRVPHFADVSTYATPREPVAEYVTSVRVAAPVTPRTPLGFTHDKVTSYSLADALSHATDRAREYGAEQGVYTDAITLGRTVVAYVTPDGTVRYVNDYANPERAHLAP
jgi:hypothetical protein